MAIVRAHLVCSIVKSLKFHSCGTRERLSQIPCYFPSSVVLVEFQISTQKLSIISSSTCVECWKPALTSYQISGDFASERNSKPKTNKYRMRLIWKFPYMCLPCCLFSGHTYELRKPNQSIFLKLNSIVLSIRPAFRTHSNSNPFRFIPLKGALAELSWTFPFSFYFTSTPKERWNKFIWQSECPLLSFTWASVCLQPFRRERKVESRWKIDGITLFTAPSLKALHTHSGKRFLSNSIVNSKHFTILELMALHLVVSNILFI